MLTFLFDIDDTLYDQVAPFAGAYEMVFRNRFSIETEALFRRSRKHSDDVFEQSCTGKMAMEDMYAYRLQKAFEDFGVTITREEALAFQTEYEVNQRKIALSENLKGLLQFCYGKTKLGIISNGPSAHQWEKARTLGIMRWIPEGNIFISSDFGVAKPDKRLFDIALKQMKPEDDCFYIGDSFTNDIIGAKNAGLKAIWLNRRNHILPEGGVAPDAVVTSEQELATFVKSLICLKVSRE